MRTNGFLITAKIFVPVDVADLDDLANKTAAIKAADAGDLSQLAGVGGVVLETSRKHTSKELPAPQTAGTVTIEPETAADPASADAPAAEPAESTGKKSRAAA